MPDPRCDDPRSNRADVIYLSEEMLEWGLDPNQIPPLRAPPPGCGLLTAQAFISYAPASARTRRVHTAW